MPKTYSRQEMGEILRQVDNIQEEVSWQQIIEIAAELGIAEKNLQRAEEIWLSKKATQQNDLEVSRSKEKKRARYLLGWKLHLIPYIFVSIFLCLLNISTTPRYLWCAYPVLGWGLGVVMHGTCVLNKKF